jgi:hypothetical protein
MRQIITLTLAMMTHAAADSQHLQPSKVKSYEHQLHDVMEITDTTYLKNKLQEVEKEFSLNPGENNKTRLGIIYHETALNLSFFSKSTYRGYAKKSLDLLSDLALDPITTPELMPFISSYRASALSLVSSETKKLILLGKAFTLFNDAVNKYSEVCYAPEFMRGSVSENMPWLFFSKRKFAKKDFQSIIDKQAKYKDFATDKIMSFTYWAWAKQHLAKKYRKQALEYLDKAIALDPDYQAGRKRAEELKNKMTDR